MSGGELPGEIVWEILVRLPVQEILRARCVCSAWRDAVASPPFIHKHRQLAEAGAIDSSALLLVASKHGTVLLNPHRHDSWAISPCFACPTHPEGLLVGAAGGLLCYHTRENLENLDDLQLNFVVWNPITKECLRIPTLHVKKYYQYYNVVNPDVTLVVRRGRLRMLAVDLTLAIAVYDLFISREAMEKRIANSGKLINALPNLWMELYVAEGCGKMLLYPDDHSTLACVGEDEDMLVDLNDFSVSLATRVAPAEVAEVEKGARWRVDPRTLSECTTGKVRVCWMRIYSLVICNLTFTTTAASGLVCRHEPLLRIDADLPNEALLIAALHGDKMLLSYIAHSEIRKAGGSKVRRRWMETFIFSDVEALSSSGSSGSSSSSERSRARVSHLKEALKIPNFKPCYGPYHRLKPSLVDSPGSLPSEKDFTWDMVELPKDMQELTESWLTSFL